MLALIAGDLAHLSPSGSFGLTTTPLGKGTFRVDHVERDSPAEHAGIRAGQRVALSVDTFGQRESLTFPIAAPGSSLTLLVEGQRNVRRSILRSPIRTTVEPLSVFILTLAYQAIRLVFVFVAALIVLRRAERADARALSSFLITIAAAFARWPWYGLTIGGLLNIVRPAAVAFGLTQAVRFATLFPDPSTRGPRRLLLRVNGIAALVGIGAVTYAPLTVLVFDAATRINGVEVSVQVLFAVYVLGGIAIGYLAGAREATESDRVRLRWIGLSTGIGIFGLLSTIVMEALGVSESIQTPFVFAMAAIPLGTAYAILRHRMLDIAFVVNRALVFGIVSAFVVGLFTLLEFTIGTYVTKFGHIQSFVLEALAALAIGASLRSIHDRADAFVDNVFFRERHRSERALRRIAKDAAYITEPDALSQRIVGAVERHASTRCAALYLRDANDTFVLRHATSNGRCAGGVVADDPAIVRARASGEPVELDQLAQDVAPSGIPGTLAFPMIVRGELVGVLSCGPKESAEAYAPDERAVLADLAQAAGIAFDTLATLALRRAVAEALAAGNVERLRAT